MKRRGFLQALLAGSAAAVAAHFGVSEAMVPEIKEELSKSLRVTHVSMGGQLPWQGNDAIWWSVGQVADVWAGELQKQSRAQTGKPLDSHLLRQSCRRMAKALDIDAMKARLKHNQKVVVGLPKLRIKANSGMGYGTTATREMDYNNNFDLLAGLDTKAGLWGPKYSVGYIQEKVWTPDQEQVDETKRIWTGLS